MWQELTQGEIISECVEAPLFYIKICHIYLHKRLDQCVSLSTCSLSIKQAVGSISIVLWGEKAEGSTPACLWGREYLGFYFHISLEQRQGDNLTGIAQICFLF